MKSGIIIVCLGVFLALWANPSHAAKCNAIKGQASVAIGDFKTGYKYLKHCDLKKDTSGETLYLLATLYQWHKVPGISKKEAHKRSLRLMHLAAIRGDIRGLVSITRLYYHGDDWLGINSNPERYSYLAAVAHSAAGHKRFERDEVLECI